MKAILNISIVLYNTPKDEVEELVHCLRSNVLVNNIYIVDNSKLPTSSYRELNVVYLHFPENLGYGKAHNRALKESLSESIPYHLVVNSDIKFDEAILNDLLAYMEAHVDVGQIMPKVYYPNGEIQYLCKLLPTPMDLIGRRFMPESWNEKRNNKFELRESGYDKILNIPYLSGCFMLLRCDVLKEVGLFDERFFMYPEDLDLTRRIHERYKTLFYPKVSIVHNHAQGSYRNVRLLWIHTINLFRYFNKWGWWSDKRRSSINRAVLNEITIR